MEEGSNSQTTQTHPPLLPQWARSAWTRSHSTGTSAQSPARSLIPPALQCAARAPPGASAKSALSWSGFPICPSSWLSVAKPGSAASDAIAAASLPKLVMHLCVFKIGIGFNAPPTFVPSLRASRLWSQAGISRPRGIAAPSSRRRNRRRERLILPRRPGRSN